MNAYTNVHGSSSIWTCRISNICLYFFQLCLHEETITQYSKFEKFKSMSYQEHKTCNPHYTRIFLGNLVADIPCEFWASSKYVVVFRLSSTLASKKWYAKDNSQSDLQVPSWLKANWKVIPYLINIFFALDYFGQVHCVCQKTGLLNKHTSSRRTVSLPIRDYLYIM